MGFPALELSVIKPPPFPRTQAWGLQVPRAPGSYQPDQEENLKTAKVVETTRCLSPFQPRRSLGEEPTPETAEGILGQTPKYTQHCLQSVM